MSAEVRVLQVAPFAIGNPVFLAGGSSIMTVTGLSAPTKPTGEWIVTCAWHNDVADPCEVPYPAGALVLFTGEIKDES